MRITVPAQLKIDDIGKIIKESSWKMIFSENEEHYNQLKAEMIEKAKDLSYDEAVRAMPRRW